MPEFYNVSSLLVHPEAFVRGSDGKYRNTKILESEVSPDTGNSYYFDIGDCVLTENEYQQMVKRWDDMVREYERQKAHGGADF